LALPLLSNELYVAVNMKTWPAECQTLSAEAENRIKTQAFTALTSCNWKNLTIRYRNTMTTVTIPQNVFWWKGVLKKRHM